MFIIDLALDCSNSYADCTLKQVMIRNASNYLVTSTRNSAHPRVLRMGAHRSRHGGTLDSSPLFIASSGFHTVLLEFQPVT